MNLLRQISKCSQAIRKKNKAKKIVAEPFQPAWCIINKVLEKFNDSEHWKLNLLVNTEFFLFHVLTESVVIRDEEASVI